VLKPNAEFDLHVGNMKFSTQIEECISTHMYNCPCAFVYVTGNKNVLKIIGKYQFTSYTSVTILANFYTTELNCYKL
jgi:hypothetical protein